MESPQETTKKEVEEVEKVLNSICDGVVENGQEDGKEMNGTKEESKEIVENEESSAPASVENDQPNSVNGASNSAENEKPAESIKEDQPGYVSKVISSVLNALPTKKPADMCHQVKWIRWAGGNGGEGHASMTPIVTQNENGPCPLLALVNVLFLRGQARLETDVRVLSSQQLLDILHNCIDRMTPELSSHKADYERNVDDALATLPKLLTGIDVNVKFTGVDQFEYTPDLLVFDLLNIPLYHGWLVEPEKGPVADMVSQYSYNQLIEYIIGAKNGNDQDIASASLAEDFLEASASQLTYRGICELNSSLKDGALCVFFRNNHFSTLLKHQDELFLMVTDQGFLHEPRVVWESLNSVDGDSRFVDMEFRTVPPKQATVPAIESAAPLAPDASPQEQLDHDLMVALSLEEQERAAANGEIVDEESGTSEERDRRLALKLQKEEELAAAQEQAQGGSPSGTTAAGSQLRGQQDHSPGSTSAGRSSSNSGGKKDKCCII